MASGINGLPNPLGAVSVPVSKYIANATHVGAAQNTGKEATLVEDSVAVQTPAASEASQNIPGCRVSTREDGSQCYQTESGLVMNLAPNMKITSIEVPGEGIIQPRNGSFTLETANGAQLPVQSYGNETNPFEGYTYNRQDGTSVHINLSDLSVGYVSKSPEGQVWQEIDVRGNNTVHTNFKFKGKDLNSQVVISTQGEISVDGYDTSVRVGSDRVQFKDPDNFTVNLKIPQPIVGLAPLAPAQTTSTPAPNGPILMENTPPPPHPEPPTQIPAKPVAHALLPSQVGFDRDEAGQTAIMMRSGLTLLFTNADGAMVRDPRASDRMLPATVENYTSADGRVEKMFRFKDVAGNSYRMFQESMDVLIDSPDGKVRQHVLPNGTILGQVEGPDGQFKRFEVTPKNEVKADPGFTIPPASTDRAQAYLTGPDGKSIQIELPYPIPSDQTNAGMYADMYGSPKYPQSGEKLPAFGNGAPPSTPTTPPGPPPGFQPAPPPQAPPMAGFDPTMGPMAGFDPTMGPMAGATVFPNPGQLQQPVEPSWTQRMKYMFTGNPADLQPRMQNSPPPPYMGAYPGGYTGYPGGSTYQPNPGYGYGMPPGGFENYGQPPGGMPPGGMPPNGGAPYPGQGPQQPNYAGQQPSYPGQMPDMPTLMERMKADFDRNNQAMWGQLAAAQAGTSMMIAGQTMNSAMSGIGMGLAMWPRSMFFSPFMW